MNKSRVIAYAFGSRLLTFVLQVLFNFVAEDHKADAYYNGLSPSEGLMTFGFSGLTRWDGQHFLDIALRGYRKEHNLAFFPLFPLLDSTIGKLTHQTVFGNNEWLTQYDCLIITAYLLNTACFITAALSLNSLTSQLFGKDPKLSAAVIYLFCLNPASIFFSAAYSESLFCALTFTGLTFLEKRPSPDQSLVSSTLFGLSCACRSNGLVTIGFLIHRQLAKLKIILDSGYNFLKLQMTLMMDVARTSSHAVLAIWPFLTFQLYCYNLFCNLPRDEGKKPLKGPEWCYEKVPFAYNFVQKKYWDVSFLGYYQLKQIPNFILASPMIFIVFLTAYNYIRLNKSLIASLGIINRPTRSSERNLWHNPKLLPYMVHAAFLASYCLLNAHVQIVTRLICSSSPLPYWIGAYCITRHRPSQLEYNIGRFTVGYSLFYFILGIALHSNFYPWT